MKNRTYKGIVALGIVGLFALAPTVFAQTTSLISVDFKPDPLFGAQGILPGDEVTGTAEVTNETDETQRVVVEAVNVYDADGLGSQLDLVISSGGVLHSDTLGNFLRDGEVFLSELGGGQSITYTFKVSFKDSSDNRYQGKSLGFDLCVGFEGGSLNCGDTVISDEDDTDGGGGGGGNGGPTIIPGGGGGGGGGGNGPIPQTPQTLTIHNERVTALDKNFDEATIEWNTNYLSTSQVIYGLQSEGPYILNLNALNFGYPKSTPEDSTKVLNHRVVLSSLVPGQIYVYRVVSRASPATVSFEHTFVYEPDSSFSNSSQSSGQSNVFVGTAGAGEVVGDIIQGDESNLVRDEGQGGDSGGEKYLAAVFAGLDGELSDKLECLVWLLLILIVNYLLVRLFFREGNSLSGTRRAIKIRRILAFNILVAIETGAAILFSWSCLVPLLLISFAVGLIFLVKVLFWRAGTQELN